MALSPDLVSRFQEWARTAGARLLVLFGSGARSAAGPLSDLDLAVRFDTLPSPADRLRIIGELQDIAGARRVDVVFLRAGLDPVLRFEIFREGHLLYESRDGLMVEERVRALFAYEDALPFRRRLRQTLHALAREGTLVP